MLSLVSFKVPLDATSPPKSVTPFLESRESPDPEKYIETSLPVFSSTELTDPPDKNVMMGSSVSPPSFGRTFIVFAPPKPEAPSPEMFM